MLLIRQFSIIAGYTLLGETVSLLMPVPVPGSVLGLMFLYLSLTLKWIKVESLEPGSSWLKDNMAFFFVPLTVGLMESFVLFQDIVFPLLIVIFVSTTLTLIISSLTTKYFVEKEEIKLHEADNSNTAL